MADTPASPDPRTSRNVPPRWQHRRFTVKEKRLTLGRQLRILGPDGKQLAFARQKMFRLREDIRIYAEQSRDTEVLVLRASKILDFNAAFEVFDPTTGEHLGIIRRKGWSSMLRDKWQFADAGGTAYATLEEDSMMMALLRRFLLSFIPSKYHVRPIDAGEDVRSAELRERFQLFGDTYEVTLHDDLVDPRVAVAMGVLLDVLGEAKQD